MLPKCPTVRGPGTGGQWGQPQAGTGDLLPHSVRKVNLKAAWELFGLRCSGHMAPDRPCTPISGIETTQASSTRQPCDEWSLRSEERASLGEGQQREQGTPGIHSVGAAETWGGWGQPQESTGIRAILGGGGWGEASVWDLGSVPPLQGDGHDPDFQGLPHLLGSHHRCQTQLSQTWALCLEANLALPPLKRKCYITKKGDFSSLYLKGILDKFILPPVFLSKTTSFSIQGDLVGTDEEGDLQPSSP